MLTWHVMAETIEPKYKLLNVNGRAAQRQLAALQNSLKAKQNVIFNA